MKIRIAIADDHPLVINGLHHVLGSAADMEITGSFANGQELLAGLKHGQPDVLLLDIQMPGLGGDELVSMVKEKYPEMKIVALTNLDNVYYIKAMLRNGADGYILKTAREEVLQDAIRTVYKGGEYVETALREKMIQDTLHAKQQLSAHPVLSRREAEVLRYIASDLTSQQIADKMFISKRTVDNHRQSLMMKLGAKNATALVKRAMQLGIV